MAWITPTVDHLQEVVSATEYEAITSAVLGDGQTGPALAAAALTKWTEHARGYVPLSISLGAPGTIPEKLLITVLVLARRGIFSRLPGLESLHGDLRNEEIRTAERTLQDCQRGEFRLEEPTTPAAATEQGATLQPAIHTRPRRFARGDEDGL
jgi:hypothetical protein